MSLDGKIALVTGATRGIGKAIALSLGEQGATVIGTATSESGAATITDFLKEANINGRGIVLNVTDADAIDNVVTTIENEFGAPEILVNNAGITRDNLLMRMKDEEWDDIINTNLTPIFKLSKRCLRAMTKARWGRIITITSVVGAMGNAGQTNYAAAKAGVIGFSKSLAREVGARGITVNTVAPGFIDTDMTSSLPEAHKTALLEQVPVKRLGAPEEIAAAVSYLASMNASYVTGETLHVNGGMYMS
ncbi:MULTISPECIES: 3-oxoacyl-ACP reductase FabG [Methylophaga]|uniref:3-oxoacyl-[acyl-carrier-protein] reductase n=1 Tax=Methylophaga aminisulfidivorans MP TaxID=1026882 RepID=F5T0D4_9GAMM|nr:MULTISPECIES: 3-oxoacyl-ACP reductase FabG [Methylophaga]EGL55255.1 dehydrogenase with different specificity [Methylophaga aminisulfidivorans MP]WVI84066.1 3-oxoacyl-ACP reductase FabG [Methylophaga thalassica]